MVVQGELTTRVQEIIHNNLIYAVGRLVAVTVYCLRGSLNLLVEEVIKAGLINLLRDR